MKQIKRVLAFTLCAGWFTVTNACSQTNTPGAAAVVGTFAASSPCSEGSRPVPGIPLKADCEFIKWQLTLYRQANTLTPTTYKLTYVYGLAQAGTTGFVGGGTTVKLEGKWAVLKGTAANPNAIIYQLDPDKPQTSISFLKLNDNLLHLLDSDRRLMIGNAGYSYTLNKIKDN